MIQFIIQFYAAGLVLNTSFVLLIAYKNKTLRRRYIKTMALFSSLSWVGVFILVRSTVLYYKQKY